MLGVTECKILLTMSEDLRKALNQLVASEGLGNKRGQGVNPYIRRLITEEAKRRGLLPETKEK